MIISQAKENTRICSNVFLQKTSNCVCNVFLHSNLVHESLWNFLLSNITLSLRFYVENFPCFWFSQLKQLNANNVVYSSRLFVCFLILATFTQYYWAMWLKCFVGFCFAAIEFQIFTYELCSNLFCFSFIFISFFFRWFVFFARRNRPLFQRVLSQWHVCGFLHFFGIFVLFYTAHTFHAFILSSF